MTPKEKGFITILCIIALIINALDCAHYRKQRIEPLLPVASHPSLTSLAVASLPAKIKKPTASALFYEGKDLTAARAYIALFTTTALEEQKRYGIPASITLAQGLLESDAGRSRLARAANNHFGVKCFMRNCPNDHCINSTDDTRKDFFKKYPSAWWSYRHHSSILALPNGPYSDCFRYGKDYTKWARALQRLGYATEKNYATQLIAIIEQLHLDRL